MTTRCCDMTLLADEWTTSRNKSRACWDATESTMGVVVVFEATAFLHSRIIGSMLAVVSLLWVTYCGHQLVALFDFMNTIICVLYCRRRGPRRRSKNRERTMLTTTLALGWVDGSRETENGTSMNAHRAVQWQDGLMEHSQSLHRRSRLWRGSRWDKRRLAVCHNRPR
jgi:hypothetical protein